MSTTNPPSQPTPSHIQSQANTNGTIPPHPNAPKPQNSTTNGHTTKPLALPQQSRTQHQPMLHPRLHPSPLAMTAATATTTTSSLVVTKNKKNTTLEEEKPLHPLTGGCPSDTDSVFCAEVARRSVARAALHLGIEGMEGVALDALGSVLLGYLDTAGTTISSMVETSGRSSAHANAYDALNAIEECTAPAAAHLGSAMGGVMTQNTNCNDSTLSEEYQGRGWEGLATFLFGSDWYTIPLEGEEEERQRKANASIGGGKDGNKISSINNGAKKVTGGKTLLPKMTSTTTNTTVNTTALTKGKQLPNLGGERNVSFSIDRSNAGNGAVDNSSGNIGSGRWDAPYLGSLAPFPLVTRADNIANPHRLQGTSAVLSLHDLAMEVEACRENGLGINDKMGLGPLTKRPRKGNIVNSESDKSKKTLPTIDKVNGENTNNAYGIIDAAQSALRASLLIPDDVYSSSETLWGCIYEKDDPLAKNKDAVGDGGKTATSGASKIVVGDNSKSSPKVTFDASAKAPPIDDNSLKFLNGEQEQGAPPAPTIIMPSYVPNFLPPFPTEYSSELGADGMSSAIASSAIMGEVLSRVSYRRDKRKLRLGELNNASSSLRPIEGKEAVAATSVRDSVRRSVIGLGKSAGPSYWGSDWLGNDDKSMGKKDGTLSSNLPSVTVTTGVLAGSELLTANAVMKEVVGSSASRKSGLDASQVVPLGRASGSRVSKILEGSMNL